MVFLLVKIPVYLMVLRLQSLVPMMVYRGTLLVWVPMVWKPRCRVLRLTLV